MKVEILFLCATIALVAGSCYERPKSQKYSQIISVPVSSKRSSCYSGPALSERYCSPRQSRCSSVCSRKVCQTVPSCSSLEAAPLVCDNVYSTGNSRVPSVVSDDFWTVGSSVPASTGSRRAVPLSLISDGAFSNGFSSLQATNGPETAPLQIIDIPPISLPAVEAPPVLLPSSQPIPAPRVIAQKCICTKTIVRPQVFRRLVTVPKLQSYIKRTVTPVVENVAYKSTPFAQTESSSSSSGSSFVSFPESSGVVLSSGSESGSAFECDSSSQSGVYSSCSPVVVSQDPCPTSCSDFVPSESCSFSSAVERSSDSSPVVFSSQPCESSQVVYSSQPCDSSSVAMSSQPCNSSPVVFSSQSCDSSPVVFTSKSCNSSPVMVSSEPCQNSQRTVSSDSCQSQIIVSSDAYPQCPVSSDSFSSSCSSFC